MIYRFLDFELDEGRFELRRNGQAIPLQARVLRALAYLVEQRERVVPKDELIDAVWKDVAVSDTALSQVIMLARRALADDAEQPALLKTVRGRGFRFTAAVQLEPDGAALPAPAPETCAADLRPSLVGRRSELQTLTGFLDQALAGRGALVSIGGEPGIGKSCLMEAFAADAAASGVDVLWGKAWEDGGAPPFWPFIQILRELVERHGPGALRSFGGPQAEALTPLWSDGAEPAALSGERAEGEVARNRFRVFDAMSRVLRGAAGKGKLRTPAVAPRLLILEDLHACDEASLLMLRFIARELSGSALLIIGTFRDLPLPQNAQLRQLLASLPDDQQLTLSGLPEADSLTLLERRLGSAPPQQLAAALQALSGGNPLFVVELARQCQLGSLPQLEQAALLQVAVPERIRSAVHIHLDALPQLTLEAITSASALGRVFSLSMLAQLLETSEHELLSQLAPAFARGILRDPGSSAGELMFAHALIRNSVYASLSPLRRAELHQRIAGLLEQRSSHAAAPLHELAHHYYLGAAVGSKHKAIELITRAAAHAQELRAYEVAAELSERALELSRHDPSAHDEFLYLFGAGNAWYQVGQLERAVARFDQAAALARGRGDNESAALAVSYACFVLRGVIMHDRVRQQQICAALRSLPETDSTMRAMLLPVSVLGRTAPSELEERLACTRAGIEMARRLGDRRTLVEALSCAHLALWGAAPAHELMAMANEHLELTRAVHDDDELLLDALLWQMVDSIELGDGQTLYRSVEEYAARVQAHNGSWHRYMVTLCEATHHSCLGNLKRADEASLQARVLGQRQKEPLAEAFFAVRQLFRWLNLGPALASADPEHAPPRDPPEALPAGYHVFWLWAWARNGRAEQARAWLARIGTQGFRDLPLDPLRRPVLACLARAAVELSELEMAEQLYAQLAPHAGLHMLLQAGVYLGPISLQLGVVAAALGRPLAAAEHFEQAQAECRQLGANAYLLQTQVEHAGLLARELSGKGTRSTRTALPLSASRLEALLDGAERLAQELERPDQLAQVRELGQQARRLRLRVSEAAS